MRNRTVLISGASVAGPALAYWLSRFGFTPTVVERAPALRGGGYAVDFRGAAHLGVLRKMGVLSAIEREQTSLRSLTFVDAQDKRIGDMPAEVFAGDVEILRGDLGQILYAATKDTTEYLFGDSISSLVQTASGVEVTFERAAARRFDLVIGADGLHSKVRELTFGPESEFSHDLGLYTAIFSLPNFLDLDHAGVFHLVPGRNASIFSARHNTDAIATLFFAASPSVAALSEVDARDPVRQREFVAAHFGELGWHVPRLLAEMERAPDFYFDSTNQIRLPHWSRGRVALIGDAGYAAGPGGNGTGTAVVAAYILAGELAAADGDHEVAFSRYEALLRDYVAGGQKQASGGRDFLVPDSWKKIKQRDRFFKMLPYLPGVTRLIRWGATRTATAITVPDYDRYLVAPAR